MGVAEPPVEMLFGRTRSLVLCILQECDSIDVACRALSTSREELISFLTDDDEARASFYDTRIEFVPEVVAEALLACNGLIATAARVLECSPHTVRGYIRRFTVCAEAMREGREGLVDAAEEGLMRHVVTGNVYAQTFVLRTLGRSRGYGHDSLANTPTHSGVIVAPAEMSEDDWRDLAENVREQQAQALQGVRDAV